MPLKKFTLDFNKKREEWELTNDQTNKVVETFDIKSDATAGGVLKSILGKDGGSVKIKKQNNRFQEERTYPGKKDPKNSRG